jgi:endoglucanase
VDPGPFLQFQGQNRDALDRILKDRINLILAAGLSVIVDFHPSEAHPDYTAKMLTAGVETPIFQAYLRLLARTADLLDSIHSERVALDLMNEPPVRPDVWQPMIEAAHAAVRHRSANLLLVLEGGEEASAKALMAMRTGAFADDPAVLFSFHYYDPYQFTHQGAPWNAARHLADVPYPALVRPLTDSFAATAAAIGQSDLSEPQKTAAYQDAQRHLEDYRRSGFDRRTIDATFDRVADWAQRQGVPASHVLLGEFGARATKLQASGNRAAEHAQWLRDVREAAEAHAFRWAVWTFRDTGGFALVDSDESNEIKPILAEALGLKSASRAERNPDDRNTVKP